MKTTILLLHILLVTAASLTINANPVLVSSNLPEPKPQNLLDSRSFGQTPYQQIYQIGSREDKNGSKYNVNKALMEAFKHGWLFTTMLVFACLFFAEILVVLIYFAIKKLKPYWDMWKEHREDKKHGRRSTTNYGSNYESRDSDADSFI